MKNRVAVWTIRLTLFGFILTGLLVYGITLAQEKAAKPKLSPVPQEVEGTKAGETATDAVFSNFIAPHLPSVFSEMKEWSSTNYPTPITPLPQTPPLYPAPMTPLPETPPKSPPIQLPSFPDTPNVPRTPRDESTTPGPAKPPDPRSGQGSIGLGPPSWVKPGVRLTFYAASANIPGVDSQIVEDENGNLIGSSGKKYREIEVGGTAGQGYVEVHVGYVDRQTAALDIRAYGKDIATGAIIILSTALGHIGPAHTGGEYWIHPQLLLGIQQRLTPGQKILRMPYHLDGRTYKALRIQTTTGNGFAYHTYDLDTGVLLSAGGSAMGGSVPVLRGDAIVRGGGTGSTFIGLMRFKSIRQLNLPWNGGAMPDWVGRTRSLTYEGTKTANVTAAGVYSFPITARLIFQQTGPGWLKYIQHGALIGPAGMPPSEGQFERVVGTSQVGGLWIPPGVLRQLRPGQVLDQDQYSHMRLRVRGVDSSGVHLIEEGPRASRAYTYNIQNGMLVGYSDSKKLDMVTETNFLSLRGRD